MQITAERSGHAPIAPDFQAPPTPPGAAREAEGAVPTTLTGADAALPPEILIGIATESLREKLGALAENAAAFHALFAHAFGEHDPGATENLRQRVLQGDFSWLPRVEFVSSGALGGANGAYDVEHGVVYLNADRVHDGALVAQVLAEEVGHHLDAMLCAADTPGDEGEVFRRLLYGEQPTTAELTAARAENDHGTITVQGRRVEVEFWNPMNLFEDIGGALATGTRAVGGFLGTGFKSVGDALSGAARALWGATEKLVGDAFAVTRTAAMGVWNATAGAIISLLFDGSDAAWDKLSEGLSGLLFRAPERALESVFNLADGVGASVEELLPFAWMRSAASEVRHRVVDASRNLTLGVFGAGVGAVRNIWEARHTVQNGLELMRQGDLVGGLGKVGLGVVKVPQTALDAVMMVGGKAVSAAQTLTGFEQPGRRLTAEEVSALRPIFGDSIDYDSIRIKQGDAGVFSANPRPFTHGNTIYMKGVRDDAATAVREDLAVLVSEATHVWQYQNGGSDYASEALWSQAAGDGYDWRKDVPATPWAELEPEQQDQFLRDAYVAGAFASVPPAFPPGSAPTGVSLAELNAYLEQTLLAIRAGRGAP